MWTLFQNLLFSLIVAAGLLNIKYIIRNTVAGCCSLNLLFKNIINKLLKMYFLILG